jgi:hypothetical protein
MRFLEILEPEELHIVPIGDQVLEVELVEHHIVIIGVPGNG